jgi:two-component system, OmpR family, response regulator
MSAVSAFLVEDSALVLRELASMLWETCAIRVVASSDSEAHAVKTLRVTADTYDLIVIDVFLKQGSGLRVLHAAKRLQAGARLIVLTNYATLDVRKRCIVFGADRVFDKSLQLEEFVNYCNAMSLARTVPNVAPPDGAATVADDAAHRR